MKKVLLGVALVSSLAMAEGFVVEPKIGFDLTTSKLNGINLKRGVTLGAEVRKEVLTNLEVGAGIDTVSRSAKKGANLRSVPLYLTGKYSFDEVSGGFKPYVKGKLGYAFNNFKYEKKESTSGPQQPAPQPALPKEGLSMKAGNGVYFGIGAGVEYKNWNVDLSYNVNRFPLKTKEMTAAPSVASSSGRGGSGVASPLKTTETKKSINNSAITLNVGYSFEF